MIDVADYIVVGAGTSGSAVAGRLAEDGRHSVAVIEAGPMDSSPWIHLPIGFYRALQNPRLNWGYQAAFDASNSPRAVNWPRGKVVGGSGSINGLIYVRGQKEDYRDWNTAVGGGWDWEDVAPCFEKLEQAGMVSPPRWRHPLVDAFIESAKGLGIPGNDGFNGASQEGAGYFHLNTHGGRRASTARRFLHPQRRAARLELICEALVERIVIEDDRASAVCYRRGGQAHEVRARRAIVLSAGAIGSPHILQRSGIGSGAVLQRAGVERVKDVPGVGRNLRDHFAVRTIYRVNGIRTLNDLSRSPISKAAMGLRYALWRDGPLSVGAGVGGLFTSVMQPGDRPDVQYVMGPLSSDSPEEGLHRWPGMTLTFTQSHPHSTGWVEIVDPDPAAPPKIVANYLADERDHEVVMRGMELARRVVAQPPLARYLEDEHVPGAQCQSRRDILDYAMQFGGTLYHPCGTVRMGTNPDAPLDRHLRLKGIDGLRVVDASIMPTEISGNINAACAMIGMHAAEMILADR